jgi:hypothetical protein
MALHAKVAMGMTHLKTQGKAKRLGTEVRGTAGVGLWVQVQSSAHPDTDTLNLA